MVSIYSSLKKGRPCRLQVNLKPEHLRHAVAALRDLQDGSYQEDSTWGHKYNYPT